MKKREVINYISDWLLGYCKQSNQSGFVVGISGGIDSAVTSTLCALTGKKTFVLNMPIRQHAPEFERSNEHIQWLKTNFKNVESDVVQLSEVFTQLENALPKDIQDFMTMANARARLRMTTLYAFASHHKLLVAGTGNKIEDFGIGFFTKYGDGGVDLSPIADLTKTEVYELAAELKIAESIQKAKPTDGLFADSRSDEDQIGASYPELEWAMDYVANMENYALSERQKEVMKIYTSRNIANRHKMDPIPVCLIPHDLKK